MAKATVGERILFNLQFSENFLDLLGGPFGDLPLACELEVVDVFGHQADECADSVASAFELKDKFSVV